MAIAMRVAFGGVDTDADLVARLRDGDESAFVELLRKYQARLLRLAESTVSSKAIAEEVCQDTWLAVVKGIERFEGRSSFKTWLFTILMNRSRTAAGKETRAGLPVDIAGEHFDKSGAWSTPPTPWSDRVDDEVVASGLAHRIRELLPELPQAQRQVVTLRDVEGLSAEEVAQLLGLSEGNQRVLLHRGRAQLRTRLSAEMGAVE